MAALAYRMRAGSVHGTKHARLNMNNQDALQLLSFSVKSWKRTFRMGIVSDGCSGIPAFTRSEVGSNLIVVFCLARIQELILGGAKMEDIPLPLFHAVTSFLRDLANTVAPANIYWPYPMTFRGVHGFRNSIKAPQRFMTDYLSATIVGFVDDGETLVTFQAGDGVLIVDDEVTIVDQNNQPEYPSVTVNSSTAGFTVNTYPSAEVARLVIATDGIQDLLEKPEVELADQLFAHKPDDLLGLQYLLNILHGKYPQEMSDDVTVITRERIEEGEEE